MSLLAGLDHWIAHLVIGLLIVVRMAAGAFILVRIRRTPIWVFLLLVPLVEVVAIWAFAYARWPAIDPPRSPAERRL